VTFDGRESNAIRQRCKDFFEDIPVGRRWVGQLPNRDVILQGARYSYE
jgi:hypothetical protein